jgi:hypothetical protein
MLNAMKALHEILENVKDQESFIVFAKALMKDREPHEGKKPNEVGFVDDWANNDIWGFLESAIGWAESSDFGLKQDPSLKSNPWRQFATFLYCGKIYE